MKSLKSIYFYLLLASASCSPHLRSQVTPPYGSLLSDFPQDLKPRTESVRIDEKTSMTDIFLSLGFYEASYIEFKEWASHSEEGKKFFVSGKEKAHLIRSPQGSVLVERISKRPITKLSIYINNESGSWKYSVVYSEANDVWKIENIAQIAP